LKSGFANPDAESLIGSGASLHAVQAMAAAVATGVCDRLAMAACSSVALARGCRLSVSALERLLHLLEALGVVRKKGGLYQNSALAKKYLCRGSRTYLGDYIMHCESMIDPWRQLPYALRTGRMHRLTTPRLAGYSRQLKRFLHAMENLGRIKCELIEERFNIHRYKRMLDLGGGMGTYSVGFARSNRQLHSVLCDLKDVTRHARSYIRQAGMQDRISVAAGECLSAELPKGPFDLVFISNLLHVYGPKECKKIIRMAAQVLAPHGAMLIHDYMFGCGDQLAVALFDISMLVGTPRGRCHAHDTLREWLEAAGIRRLRHASILAGTSIMWGHKEPSIPHGILTAGHGTMIGHNP
jgi:ubiquinone/menaquinone biosynthesis C-methylase UbiE